MFKMMLLLRNILECVKQKDEDNLPNLAAQEGLTEQLHFSNMEAIMF